MPPLLTENSFQRLADPILGPAENLTLEILITIREASEELIENPDQMLNREALRNQIEDNWQEYNSEARSWVDNYLSAAYLRGIKKTNGVVPSGIEANSGIAPEIELGAAAGVSGGGGTIAPQADDILKEYPKHHSIYTAFQDAAYKNFNQTKLPVLTDAKGKLRDLIIQASEASYQGADTFTRRKMTQNLLTRFADQNITGIRYADGRTMNLDAYSEMVARSQTGNAARQASINRQQQYNLDLVQISQHFPTSDLCRPWQARIYTISGTSGQYPPLSEAISGGLYHPNCLHYQSPYVPDVSELPDKEMSVKRNRRQYEATQRQRTIERRIRKYKRREATAVTDEAAQKAQNKIQQWQKVQRDLIDDWDHLRRKYPRESITATGRDI